MSIAQLIRNPMPVVREYSPIPLFVVGISLLYIFTSIGFWSISGPILGVTIGSLIGLIGVIYVKLGNVSNSHSTLREAKLDSRISTIISCIFVITMVWVFRINTYHRPSLFYILFAGFASFIAYQIAQGKGHTQIAPQILILAFFTYWSSQWLFPAGMYAADTAGYVRDINDIFQTGTFPEYLLTYAGHIIYAVQFKAITGLPSQVVYYLLSTLLLVCTVPFIMILHSVVDISKEISQYAALIFSISSWMIGRGMHPNKLNYFYGTILLLVIVSLYIYHRTEVGQNTTNRMIVVGLIIIPYLVFGHQFSAGVGMIFCLSFLVFGIFIRIIKPNYYRIPSISFFIFSTVFILSVIGNPLHKKPLIERLSGLLLSLTTSGSGAGGPGRYSELALDVLIVSTASQTILFILATVGAIWLFRQRKWEYDLIIFWMAFIAMFLAVSLLQNTTDTATQRFYSYLILFGFNICAGATLSLINKLGNVVPVVHSPTIGRTVVASIIVILAITSLASPVADKATSPVADDLPHFRQFNTDQQLEGRDWLNNYASEAKGVTRASRDLPIERTGRLRGVANVSSLDHGTVYSYSDLAERTGVMVKNRHTLGGRIFLFVSLPSRPSDSKIYSNSEMTVYIRN